MEKYRRAITIGTLLAVFVGGVLGIVYARQSLKWERVPLQTQRQEETVYLPPSTALKMSSLGYGPFWSDMLFIRTHAYFLRHMYGDRILKWLDPYVDAIVTLDPNNREIYYWASMVVRYGQIIDEGVIERSNRFAELGIERFPDDARLYVHVGFNKYFELRPLYMDRERAMQRRITETREGPEQVALLRRLADLRSDRYALERDALHDYTIGAMLPNSGIDPVFLVTLYVKQDEIGAATSMIRTLYPSVSPDDREQLLVKLEELGESELADELRRASSAHTEEMPYVPEGLYRLVGSRKDIRIPERWNDLGLAYDQALRALEARERQEVEPP